MAQSSLQWAQSIERWIEEFVTESTPEPYCDVLVIGSGYGGSFAAKELAAAGRTVWVMERGREFALGEFPETIGNLPGQVRMQSSDSDEVKGYTDALLDFHSFDQLQVLVANGLGGGSLINAGVAVRPDPGLLQQAGWPSHYRKGEQGVAAFNQALTDVEAQLQVRPLSNARALKKFQALDTLGQRYGLRAEPAPLTIASVDQVSPAGVSQTACTRCGNCFTGCNVGAKNTLVSHVVPAAVRKGARFFTGATALEVRPITVDATAGAPHHQARWEVELVLSKGQRQEATRRTHKVRAHTVVLAAGTLGSTEILLRSNEVSRSALLGSRFSTNGDVLGLGWGLQSEVNGFGNPDASVYHTPPPDQQVGPTITGIVRAPISVSDGGQRTVLIEDGAVPSALSKLVVALASTLSLPHRYTGPEGPGFFAKTWGTDRLATPENIGQHALLLLGMGPDDADGTMYLKSHDNEKKSLHIAWKNKDAGPGSAYYKAVDSWLGNAAKGSTTDGFQGGDYLPNPMWKALPKDFNEITGGAGNPIGVTVHPLGGCPMGDDSNTGVVDWMGTVFRQDGGVNAGLHVLDGAMLPTAVGVNPFLTISALCVVAARAIAASLPVAPKVPEAIAAPIQPRPQARAADTGPSASPATDVDTRVKLSFREHLQGHIQGQEPAWLGTGDTPAPATAQERERAWIAAVDVELDVDAWLANPSKPLPGARMRLFRNPHAHDISVHPDACKGTPEWEGTGNVSLLALNAPSNLLHQIWRMFWALMTFLSRRSYKEMISLANKKVADEKAGAGALIAKLKTRVAGFVRAARNLSYRRELIYSFELRSTTTPGLTASVNGRKTLAYAPFQKNVWNALVDIDLRMVPSNGAPAVTLSVTADLIDMVRNRRLQVAKAPDTPTGIIAMAAFSSLWLRAIFQSHFWSFRGLDYDKLEPPPVAQHGDLRGAKHPVRIALPVPRRQGVNEGGELLNLELTRYSPLRPTGVPKHMLMVHGLAHGGTVFTTDTTDGNNMAAAFVADGFTVWVLDHRLSNRLPYFHLDHSMDDVALLDIPAAVRYVYQAAGQPISVFAHCVGGGAFAMATLQGLLEDPVSQRSMVASATIHAVHPWVVPSASNQLSGTLGSFYRDFLPDGMTLNPVPPSGNSGVLDQLLDRMSASLPWPDDEIHLHLKDQFDAAGGTATCNRMTLFYGREWVHGNLAEATHRELASLVGPASVDVFRQLFFVINRQRLTNKDGANVYMTQTNFHKHWTFPILFAHGSQNKVFDPRSAVRSWTRLRDMKTASPVRFFMADGFGHMDFLFGKLAHQHVYPDLVKFFADPHGYASPWGADQTPQSIPSHWRDHDAHDVASPLTGPRVQTGSVLEGSTERKQLSVWVEFPNDPCEEDAGLAVYDQNGLPLNAWSVQRLHSSDFDTGPQDNITLLQGPGAYFWGRLTDSDAQPLSALESLELRWHSKAGRLLAKASIPLAGQAWWQQWHSPQALPVAWLATSCRWPGTPFERMAVDRVAQSMLQQTRTADAPALALVMLGDQIYADAAANLVKTRSDDELLAGYYRDAWGSPHAQTLLGSLPSYTVVDDHEIGDNWSGTTHRVQDKPFVNGFEAALAYQWRWDLSGAANTSNPHIGEHTVSGFWRSFDIGGIPAFAADTRTERALRDKDNWTQQRMFSDAQFDAIKAWLLTHKDQPKILCSGSVFGFMEREVEDSALACLNGDGWSGYPRTWKALVEFIVQEQINNIVFLSGDYHFSGIADLKLESDTGPAVHAVSVVCSGWNSTLPFANAAPRDFVMDAPVLYPLSDKKAALTTTATAMSTAPRQFSKLTIEADAARCWWINVQVFDADGAPSGVAQRRRL